MVEERRQEAGARLVGCLIVAPSWLVSSMSLLHLIYIHGFQGNDRSFQSFPTDLQDYLRTRSSSAPNISIKSTIYPTYKSTKPLANATRNFLEWLTTQPPSYVILMGHSIGGLLAAEAALDPSNNPIQAPQRQHPIIAVVTFDCPFLGLHPHVIKSGIASLFAKDPEAVRPNPPPHSESELNPHIHMADHRVTDEWEQFKRSMPIPPKTLPPRNAPAPSPGNSSTSWTNTMLSSIVQHGLPYFDKHAGDPRYKWIKKHADDPAGSIKRWVVERFQFGSCMFDPHGLKDRYEALANWNGGYWVNYWTHVPRRNHAGNHGGNGENQSIHSASSTESEELQTFVGGGTNKFSDHHFSLLPTTRASFGSAFGGQEKWEGVLILGAKDEVEAHCGIFIRSQNLEYDHFVERVGQKVLSWVHAL